MLKKIAFILVLNILFINIVIAIPNSKMGDTTSDKTDELLDALLEEDDSKEFYNKAKKIEDELQENQELEANQLIPYFISFIFSHSTPVMYKSGANMPNFLYIFDFQGKVPFNVENKLVSKGFFSFGLSNSTTLIFDKINLYLLFSPIPFLEFKTGINNWFHWKFNGNSALYQAEDKLDEDLLPVDGVGLNIDLAIILKLNLQMFHPKVKLVFMDTVNFQYWSYPEYYYWYHMINNITISDSWTFTNSFRIIWREKYFMPMVGCDLSLFFDRIDDISLFVFAGFKWILPKKSGVEIMLNGGVYVLEDDIARNIKLTFMLSHKIGEVKINKKEK